jgi:S-DNA-T family DNA segregation ATPase FtsK/SpoIIIE
MDRRYRLLHANHARNLTDFNRKVREKRALVEPTPTVTREGGSGIGGDASRPTPPAAPEYSGGILPYIVLLVDELADLMLTVQGEIETPLATLAQKARAIGIHLILATQRPSVNVLTGLIKANFSCRIAFRVSAKVDSRTILAQNGAETLLANGDMLFPPPPKRDPLSSVPLSYRRMRPCVSWTGTLAIGLQPTPIRRSATSSSRSRRSSCRKRGRMGGAETI